MEKLRVKVKARYAFAAFLGEQGKRCTPERLLVLDVALSQSKPFTADGLFEACCADSQLMRVSRATVFNTLPLLVGSGLFRRNNDARGSVTYEPMRSSHPRQLLVCATCGKVQRRTSPAMALWLESQTFRNFHPRIDSATLTLYGECSRCRNSHKH